MLDKSPKNGQAHCDGKAHAAKNDCADRDPYDTFGVHVASVKLGTIVRQKSPVSAVVK